MRWGWLLAGLVGVGIYLPTLSHEFTFDDSLIIVGNPRIVELGRPGLYLATSWWNEKNSHKEYRPAAMASFALNHAVGGLDPAGYHAVNVALHGLISMLIWLLARRLGAGPAAATVAAVIFALHPVHIESVAGVVGRSELMVTLGFVATLLAAHMSFRATGTGGRRGWAAAAFPLALLAVFSKEHGVLLPVAILIFCVLPQSEAAGGRRRAESLCGLVRARLPRLLPALIVVVVAVALYFVARKAVIGSFLRPEGSPINAMDNPLVLLAGIDRLLTALSIVGRYALLLVAPFYPSPDYSLRAITPVTGIANPLWVPGLLLLGSAGAGVYLLRRRAVALFGLLLMLVTFLVSSNLFLTIGTIMAERLLYLPSVGFCLLVAALGIGESAAVERARAPRLKGALVGFSIWAAALLVQHARYLPKWKDEECLFTYMVGRVPNSARARVAYSSILFRRGDLEGTVDQLRRALKLHPDLFEAVGRLGITYALLGRDEEALRQLERAHASDPSRVDVNKPLSEILTRQGRLERAERILREGLRASRGGFRARMLLGLWLDEQGRGAEALTHLDRAYPHADPSDKAKLLLILGWLHVQQGQPAKALPLLEQYTEARPTDPEGHLWLAHALHDEGRTAEARRWLEQIIDQHPDYEPARRRLEKLSSD